MPDNAMSLLVADAPSLWVGNGDFSWVVVARWANDAQPRWDGDAFRYAGFGGLITKVESSPPFRGVSMWANYPGPSTEVAWTRFVVQLDNTQAVALSYSQNLNDNEFRVVTTVRRGQDLSVRLNGQFEGGAEIPRALDCSAPNASILIGGQRGQPLYGDIAEVILITDPVVIDDVIQLEQHLMHKYALD